MGIMKLNTSEQITSKFIKDGWNQNISFEELSLEEATQKGYSFAINGIAKGRKYFKMNASGDIYNDNGKIAMFNVPTRN